jgi:hypothetical protein
MADCEGAHTSIDIFGINALPVVSSLSSASKLRDCRYRSTLLALGIICGGDNHLDETLAVLCPLVLSADREILGFLSARRKNGLVAAWTKRELDINTLCGIRDHKTLLNINIAQLVSKDTLVFCLSSLVRCFYRRADVAYTRI